MRRRSIEDEVNEGARRIKHRLMKKAGGRLPRTQRDWLRLAWECGVLTVADFECRPSFQAELAKDEYEQWVITYNPYAGADQVKRFLCHELGELHAHHDYASLFDDFDRDRRFSYDGSAGDAKDIRHKIACRLERLCFRK